METLSINFRRSDTYLGLSHARICVCAYLAPLALLRRVEHVVYERAHLANRTPNLGATHGSKRSEERNRRSRSNVVAKGVKENTKVENVRIPGRKFYFQGMRGFDEENFTRNYRSSG